VVCSLSGNRDAPRADRSSGYPFADCIRHALDDAIAKTRVPPEATAVLGRPLEFKLP